jgi:hypothetical protein
MVLKWIHPYPCGKVLSSHPCILLQPYYPNLSSVSTAHETSSDASLQQVFRKASLERFDDVLAELEPLPEAAAVAAES